MNIVTNLLFTDIKNEISNRELNFAVSMINDQHPDFIYHSVDLEQHVIVSSKEIGYSIGEVGRAYLNSVNVLDKNFSVVIKSNGSIKLYCISGVKIETHQVFNQLDDFFYSFIKSHGESVLVLGDIDLDQKSLAKKQLSYHQISDADLDNLTVNELQKYREQQTVLTKKTVIASVAILAALFSIAYFISDEEQVVDAVESEIKNEVTTIKYAELYDDFKRGSSKGIYINIHEIVKVFDKNPFFRLDNVKGDKEEFVFSIKPRNERYDINQLSETISSLNNVLIRIEDGNIKLVASLIPTPALKEPVLANQYAIQRYIDNSISDWLQKVSISFKANEELIGYQVTPTQISLADIYYDDLDVLTTILNGFPIIYESMEFNVAEDQKWQGNINFSLYSCGNTC